jgi:hypothetical protein
MARKIAAPKTTGGGGFVFEDDVCAWLMACILAGKSVFNPEYGPPVRLDFQTKPAGWFLDDVLVTTKGDTTYHIEFSLKSNPQFTASKAPRDFVKTIWEQWLHIGSEVFDRSLDLMGIITANFQLLHILRSEVL